MPKVVKFHFWSALDASRLRAHVHAVKPTTQVCVGNHGTGQVQGTAGSSIAPIMMSSSQPAARSTSSSRSTATTPATVSLTKMLTNHVTSAATLDQLHQLTLSHMQHIDHIHVAAIAVRAAQLTASSLISIQPDESTQQLVQYHHHYQHLQQPQGQQALPTLLVEMVSQRLRHYNSASLTPTVWALAKLSFSDSTYATPALVGSLADKAQGMLIVLTGQQLCTVLWGLAKMGYRAKKSWLKDYLHAVSKHMASQQLTITDLSILMYSLAVMEHHPAQAWFATWQAAVLQCDVHAASPLAISNMLWGLGHNKLAPSSSWLTAVLTCSMQQLPSFGAQECSNTIWAVARLGVAPPDGWLYAFMAAVYQNMQVRATMPI